MAIGIILTLSVVNGAGFLPTVPIEMGRDNAGGCHTLASVVFTKED